VDTLAIHLLGRAISLHGDPIVRTIYGTFKPEIDQAIRGGLGGIKVHMPEMLQYPAEVAGQKQGQGQKAPKPAASVPPRKPARATSDAGVMDMKVGADGVYEVSDAH
jgi:hypothetical protein